MADHWVIQRATDLASRAHRGVNRKYTGDPYILHPMRVALKTANWLPGNSIAVAAAVLHDVIEDTIWTETDIRNLVGYQVSELVAELTNPSKGFPKLSRAERKKMDREHLAKVSLTAKVIKAIDRIDNLNEMTGADDGFKQKYADESQALLDESLRPCLMPNFFLLVSDFEFAIKSLRETIKGEKHA